MPDKNKVAEKIAQLKKDASERGYCLSPDEEMVYNLAEGLLINKERYGLEICPCRLLIGKPEDNLDIVCPCDYRDTDIAEKGACFCGLYISPETLDKGGPQSQITESRPAAEGKTPPENNKLKDTGKRPERGAEKETEDAGLSGDYPLWRCKVCGYLCANKQPPKTCPICKVGQERFEKLALVLKKA